MTLQFSCPVCMAAIEADVAAVGRRGRCPRCSESLVVPEPAAQRAAARRPVSAKPWMAFRVSEAAKQVGGAGPAGSTLPGGDGSSAMQRGGATGRDQAGSNRAEESGSVDNSGLPPLRMEFSVVPEFSAIDDASVTSNDAPADGDSFPDVVAGAKPSINKSRVPAAKKPLPGEFPPTISVAESSAVQRGRKKQRLDVRMALPARKINWRAIAALVCGVAAILAIVGFGVWYMQPSYIGELELERLVSKELDPIPVGTSVFEIPPAQLKRVLTSLENDPLKLESNRMLVRLESAGGKLFLHIAAPPGTAIYRLDATDRDLREYVRKNRDKWAANRAAVVGEYGSALFRKIEKLQATATAARKSSRDRVEDEKLRPFRDSALLPAAVISWGAVVEVVESGGAIHPCVYEDDRRRLYFILPERDVELTLRGKKDGKVLPTFEGEYTLTYSEDGGTAESDSADARPGRVASTKSAAGQRATKSSADKSGRTPGSASGRGSSQFGSADEPGLEELIKKEAEANKKSEQRQKVDEPKSPATTVDKDRSP